MKLTILILNLVFIQSKIIQSKNRNKNKDKGKIDFTHFIVKLREREGQRVDLGRSLKGHLWMVDGGWWYTFP